MLGELYLSASTIDKVGFIERLDAAAGGDYQGIGLRPTHYKAAQADGFSDADMRAMLADRGLEVTEIGFVANWWDGPESSLAHEQALYRLKDALGGRHLMMIGGPMKDPVDLIAERFAGVCDRAAEHGLRVALEFLPWTDMDDAGKAWQIAELSGRANGGVALDVWHHNRHGADDDLVRAIPAERIVTIQISDGEATPTGTDLEDTFNRRLLPGEGDFDVVALMTLLDSMGVAAPVGIEVLSEDMRSRTAAEVARLGADATRKVLAAAASR
jgi:sugar phosphate isomerase/epimerase